MSPPYNPSFKVFSVDNTILYVHLMIAFEENIQYVYNQMLGKYDVSSIIDFVGCSNAAYCRVGVLNMLKVHVYFYKSQY